MNEFEQELTNLLNRTSQENGSNTPDFILAKFLLGCLSTYNQTLQAREQWYGRPIGGMKGEQPTEASV